MEVTKDGYVFYLIFVSSPLVKRKQMGFLAFTKASAVQKTPGILQTVQNLLWYSLVIFIFFKNLLNKETQILVWYQVPAVVL